MKNTKITLGSQVREGISNTLRICMREFQLIFKDVGVMILVFAVPLIYPMLYSFIYYPEVVRDLPIAVVDLSKSSASRQYIRDLDATPDVKVANSSISMAEAVNMFKKRQVRGIVQIPETFTSDIALAGRQQFQFMPIWSFFSITKQ